MKLRKFTHIDLNTMKLWLAQDYIQKYFGNPQEWIDEIAANLDAEWVKYFIVEHNTPIGFVQYYETDIAPLGEWSDEPIGTVGIDYLIGNTNYLGKGYGTKIVTLLLDFIKTKKQYDYIVADPITDNLASVKVLRNNGFEPKNNGLFVLDLNNNGIEIFRANENDVEAITQLFRDTIQNVNAKDYPPDEIDDWSGWWTAHNKWKERIETQYFIKATFKNNVVGFSSLANDGYLDFMFTHKDYQRHGIAANLLSKIERKARLQGNKTIYSDVSLTAKGFFEKHGYIVEKQQLKRSKNKELVNFRMTKNIEQT